MIRPHWISVSLLSDATFGSGETTPGEVHIEIDHDELGLPYLRGRTIRGLLRDSWLTMAAAFPELERAALRVLGPTGDLEETSIVRIGDGRIDDTVRAVVRQAVTRSEHPLSPAEILESLTDVRVQAAETRDTGATTPGTLRMTRVLLRGTMLHASLGWLATPDGDDVRCLALAALATRHVGSGRNRGRGHVLLEIDGDRDATIAAALGGVV